METSTVPARRSSLRDMFLIGGAWFGMSVFFAFNMASVPLYFSERIEQKWVVGLILSTMGAFGMFLSPLIGLRSDRIRHRLGRRRPLIILALPFVVSLLMFAQYLPSTGLLAVVWPFVYFFHLIIERPFNALIPDLFPSGKRATANGVTQFFGGAGNLLYFVLGSLLWARSQEATFYLIGIIYLLGILLVIFGIKEQPTDLREIKQKSTMTFRDYLRDLRTHKALLNYALASLFWQIGLNGVLPWLTSFGTIEMGMSVEMSFLILALSVGVLILLAVPVGVLADRFGRRRLTSIGLVLFVVVNSMVMFVHSVPLLFVLMGIVSLGFCILMVVPYAIMVNLIPDERMAELAGVAAIPIYLSVFIGPFLSGLLIDAFGSYRPIFAFAAFFHLLGFLLLQRVKEVRAPQISYERT